MRGGAVATQGSLNNVRDLINIPLGGGSAATTGGIWSNEACVVCATLQGLHLLRA